MQGNETKANPLINDTGMVIVDLAAREFNQADVFPSLNISSSNKHLTSRQLQTSTTLPACLDDKYAK